MMGIMTGTIDASKLRSYNHCRSCGEVIDPSNTTHDLDGRELVDYGVYLHDDTECVMDWFRLNSRKVD